MKTEFCVDTTCRAAPEHGFRTVLISDAHTTMDNKYLSASEIIAHHNVTLAGPFVTLAPRLAGVFILRNEPEPGATPAVAKMSNVPSA
jgi:uncharacterized membrane protein